MSAPLLAPDAFGVPGQGIHVHVGGVAILDVIGTIALGYGIAKWGGLPTFQTVLATFVVGEIAHWYVGVPTTMSVALGLVPPPA